MLCELSVYLTHEWVFSTMCFYCIKILNDTAQYNKTFSGKYNLLGQSLNISNNVQG
jgi:hypothetical protein